MIENEKIEEMMMELEEKCENTKTALERAELSLTCVNTAHAEKSRKSAL